MQEEHGENLVCGPKEATLGQGIRLFALRG
jgi:hypothetical protein